MTMSAPDKESSPLIGVLEGKISVPDDFDTMGADEFVALFEGADDVES